MLPCLLVEPSLPLRWPPIGKSLLSGRNKLKKILFTEIFVLQKLQKITPWLVSVLNQQMCLKLLITSTPLSSRSRISLAKVPKLIFKVNIDRLKNL